MCPVFGQVPEEVGAVQTTPFWVVYVAKVASLTEQLDGFI